MRMIFVVLLGLGMSVEFAHAGKRALVYKGPGACSDGCYDAAFQVALQAGLDPVFVSETALTVESTPADRAKLFQDAALWIQPGGKSKTAIDSMSSTLKSAIDSFVRAGGGYVGFCAGAFASTRYVGTTWTYGFNFMPGKTALYKTDTGEASIIPIQWNGKARNLYWEGGPYLSRIPVGRVEAVGTYPNGQVAAAKSTYGKGRIFVTGLHPEAPQDWRDYYHLNDSDGLDQDLAVDMIHWVIESTQKAFQ